MAGMSPVMAQTTGGPDAYGYVWRNSDDPMGPAYQWIDITTAGTQVAGLADDNAVGPFNIGFNFPYYWSDYGQIWIGSNGWISFKQIGNIAHCFPQIPSPGGNGDDFVAPYMTDLNFSTSYPGQFPNVGEIYWWSNNTDTLIVAYHDVPWWKDDANGLQPPDWVGSNTFEVIFSAVDSSITFMYQNMDAANFNNTQFCDYDLEIGMENVTGNIGLEVAAETVPQSMSAVKFYYPSTVTLQIADAKAH